LPKQKKPNQKMQAWITARRRHHLSHAQVQMARELGMNPKTLGKLDNHDQEPWKMPLRHYIEHLYQKQFGKERPDVVLSLEEKIRRDEEKKARKREEKRLRREREAAEAEKERTTTHE
jgi:DNA-binding XRE family transcriptional regulator